MMFDNGLIVSSASRNGKDVAEWKCLPRKLLLSENCAPLTYD